MNPQVKTLEKKIKTEGNPVNIEQKTVEKKKKEQKKKKKNIHHMDNIIFYQFHIQNNV